MQGIPKRSLQVLESMVATEQGVHGLEEREAPWHVPATSGTARDMVLNWGKSRDTQLSPPGSLPT